MTDTHSCLGHGSVLVQRGLHQRLLQRRHAVLQLANLGTDAGQALGGALQLAVGLSQCRTLGRDDLQCSSSSKGPGSTA